jgi:hypothetical protein
VTYRRFRSPRMLRRAVGAVLLLALALVAVGAAAQARLGSEPPARHVVVQGVAVAGVDLSGLTRRQAERKLRSFASRPVTLVYRHHRWRYVPQTLGATIDVGAAVTAALAAPEASTVSLPVGVDRGILRRWLHGFARRFDVRPRDAEVVLHGLRPHVTESRRGRRLSRWLTRSAITGTLRSHGEGPVHLHAKILRPKVSRTEIGPVIVIRRDSNRLLFYRGAARKGMHLVRAFRVATGQAAYPTPLGSFTIADKQRDPWWYPPSSPWAAGAEPVPPGPGNPLGTRWMGLSDPLVGIHGTPDAASIGYSASHGCIRMLVPEAEWLFDHVSEGTPVFIVAA